MTDTIRSCGRIRYIEVLLTGSEGISGSEDLLYQGLLYRSLPVFVFYCFVELVCIIRYACAMHAKGTKRIEPTSKPSIKIQLKYPTSTSVALAWYTEPRSTEN